MIFETPRLLVRQYTIDDADDFYLLNSDPVVMKYIRVPKTRQQSLEFFKENINYYKEFPFYGRWAMMKKDSNEFVGSFMLKPSSAVNNKIELGYAMLQKYWGFGYATEAVNGCLSFAFDQLRLTEVIAITQPGNSSSKKVLLKCGFIQMNDLNDNGRLVNQFIKSNKENDRD